MDFLKSLFAMLTSSVLRLVVTVGTLAAVYFFLLNRYSRQSGRPTPRNSRRLIRFGSRGP